LENLDDQVNLSCDFILNGRVSDLKKLRQVILDFVGATMTSEGYIHQPLEDRKTSIRIVHHSLSSEYLWAVKDRDWRILQEVKKK
jgi:hypothetical protein